MPLIRLIYFSTPALDLQKETRREQINGILRTSQLNNLRRNLTSVLIYDENWFIQILEGVRSEILELYKTIEQDKRHTHVTLVEMAQTPARYFEIWSISCAERNETTFKVFAPCLRNGEFRPNEMSAYEMIALAATLGLQDLLRSVA